MLREASRTACIQAVPIFLSLVAELGFAVGETAVRQTGAAETKLIDHLLFGQVHERHCRQFQQLPRVGQCREGHDGLLRLSMSLEGGGGGGGGGGRQVGDGGEEHHGGGRRWRW